MNTYNFKMKDYPYEARYIGTCTDTRNNIKCINPSLDMECYLNYIQLLNFMRDKWKNFGYLDLGMMPLVMLPTFMNFPELADEIVSKMKEIKIPCYSVPAVSLMSEQYRTSDKDIWVFKEDIAKALHVPVQHVTLERFLRGDL